MTDKEIENIKYRLTDIGGQVGELALNYINELEKEISVLLSCANCAENKGGYICDKEYNDKCLSQKIEYIKELKDENSELETQIENYQLAENESKEIIAELKEKIDMMDFFKEGTGLKRRGLINTIQVNHYIENLETQIEQMKCKPDKETITDWLDRYQQENKTYYLISESGIAEANKDGFLAGIQAALGYINGQ